MNLKEAMRRVDQLTEAFDRQSLQLQQSEKMVKLLKQQLSELESVVIAARNALTPRGMRKMSAEVKDEVRDEGKKED